MHIFYCIFVRFMQFPAHDFGLDHFASRPFNYSSSIFCFNTISYLFQVLISCATFPLTSNNYAAWSKANLNQIRSVTYLLELSIHLDSDIYLYQSATKVMLWSYLLFCGKKKTVMEQIRSVPRKCSANWKLYVLKWVSVIAIIRMQWSSL